MPDKYHNRSKDDIDLKNLKETGNKVVRADYDELDDDVIVLYRGITLPNSISFTNEEYQKQIAGPTSPYKKSIIAPQSPHTSLPVESHIEGGTTSAYTSWTSLYTTAKNFADDDGIVMRGVFKKSDIVHAAMHYGDTKYPECEYTVFGTVIGAKKCDISPYARYEERLRRSGYSENEIKKSVKNKETELENKWTAEKKLIDEKKSEREKGFIHSGCELYLIPADQKFISSDKEKLYLYKDTDNQFYYRMHNKVIPLEDKANQLPPTIKEYLHKLNFIQPKGAFVAYNQADVVKAVLAITAKRGDTAHGNIDIKLQDQKRGIKIQEKIDFNANIQPVRTWHYNLNEKNSRKNTTTLVSQHGIFRTRRATESDIKNPLEKNNKPKSKR